MKRFFALILVALMLLPCIVSCGKEVEPPASVSSNPTQDSTTGSSGGTTNNSGTTGSSTTNSSTGSSTGNSTGNSSGNGSGETDGPEPEPVTLTKWSGETLNILATTWNTEEAGAPWSQVELTVAPGGYYDDTNFGAIINSAVLSRADFIKEVYGVDLKWINARGSHVGTILSDAVVGGSDDTNYHIAMPRMMETQSIVAANSIYNIADSEYIDLDKSYYNQASREAYSVAGITLFIAGDFSFLDEQTSYLVYYNEAMSDGIQDFPDLYAMVKEGKWTIDQMTNVAKLVTANSGTPDWTDDDTYGFGTETLSQFFQYSGIQQVSVKNGSYVLSLQDSKIDTLIDKILVITGAEWARTSWSGGYTALQAAFLDGRLLFFNEVVQKTDYFENQTEEFKVGLLPTPKLSDSQDKHYTPCSYQSVVMCIPKATPNREMSEYFFEILSYTGQKFVMEGYKLNLKNKLNAETADESMEILEDYIFANLCYDVGYMDGWTGLLSSVQTESYSTGKNNFTAAYGSAVEDAKTTIAEWNLAWMDYNEDIE